jgi:general secretion pathway protein G
MRAKSGFTLVEILIVVVILGILAAIVIPQFTGASTEAKESALVSDLQSIRSQVELYKIQHNDILPGEILNTDGSVTGATALSFVNAFTSKTDQYGNVDPGGGDPAVYRFGPYMQKLPENPFSTATAVVVVDKSEGASSVELDGTAGDNSAGWNFITAAGVTRGLFQADDGLSNDVTGQAHTAY